MSTSVAVFLAFASLILGALISLYISVRLLKPELVAVLEFGSSVLEGVKDEIRDKLTLNYRDQPIEDLYHIEFTVMNRGQKPLERYVEPLSLLVPPGTSIVDAVIAKRSSASLAVEAIQEEGHEAQAPAVHFKFPLLNTGDWFRVKLLLENEVDLEDLSLRIRAPEVASDVPFIARDNVGKLAYYVLGLVFSISGSAGLVGYLYALEQSLGVSSVYDLDWYYFVPSLASGLAIGLVVGIAVVVGAMWIRQLIRPRIPGSPY